MSASTLKTRQRKARLGRLVAPPRPAPAGTVAPTALDIRVAYPLAVSERKVDRDAWAHEVALLIDQEAKGNKSAFARRVGIPSVRNIDRWLARTVNVSEESVRQVARALNLPVVELLIKVGYYRPGELPDSPAPQRSGDDEARRVIEESNAPPSLKRELLEHLARQRAEHERQRLAEIERMLEVARRAGGQAS